ncbi:hypothetical protein ACFWIZ_45650, partial [Streptomyces sp. NPDC127044]
MFVVRGDLSSCRTHGYVRHRARTLPAHLPTTSADVPADHSCRSVTRASAGADPVETDPTGPRSRDTAQAPARYLAVNDPCRPAPDAKRAAPSMPSAN